MLASISIRALPPELPSSFSDKELIRWQLKTKGHLPLILDPNSISSSSALDLTRYLEQCLEDTSRLPKMFHSQFFPLKSPPTNPAQYNSTPSISISQAPFHSPLFSFPLSSPCIWPFHLKMGAIWRSSHNQAFREWIIFDACTGVSLMTDLWIWSWQWETWRGDEWINKHKRWFVYRLWDSGSRMDASYWANKTDCPFIFTAWSYYTSMK